MSIVKSIYNAPIISTSYDDVYGDTCVKIEYNRLVYFGQAQLHQSDAAFYSPKVGYNIALSRARIKALKYERDKAKQEYLDKRRFYLEVINFGKKNASDIDPTESFMRNINRTHARYHALQRALKKEKDSLTQYLKAQEDVIKTLKRLRNSKARCHDCINPTKFCGHDDSNGGCPMYESMVKTN